MSIGLIEWNIKALKLEYQKEVLLIKGRKFRADIFIPSLNLAIEYEGINAKTARHTSITGYSKDCEKYNLYSIHGYRLLRYTMINCKNVTRDILELIKQIEK